MPVPVAPILEEALAIVQMRPDCREVDFSVSAPDDLPEVCIAPDKLHQALVNLLINASHAVQSQSTQQVALAASGVTEGVEITVTDSGPGFSAVAMERAMEPFFTTKPVGQGIGLGLATSLQIVESAGGTLSVENRAEGGAVVRISLPSEPA